MANLIKIDKNGTKYYEGMVECPRCFGKGIYYIGTMNGRPLPSYVDNGICFQCGGAGKVEGKWKEYTPEHQAKLDAQRAKRTQARIEAWEKERAERERQEAERKAQEEAEKKAREERIKAEKAISQHIGNIGDKYEARVRYCGSGSWEQQAFGCSWRKVTMYAHKFKDEQGNVLTWKTESYIDIEENTEVKLKGTIKDHTIYKDEKQTVITRCKVEAISSEQ